MAISNANAAKLNKMNRASANVSLGTLIQNIQGTAGASGSIVTTKAHVSASAVVAYNAVTTKGYIYNYSRSGSAYTSRTYATFASGSLTVSGSSGSFMEVGDVLNYILW